MPKGRASSIRSARPMTSIWLSPRLRRNSLLIGGLPEAVNKFLETRDLIQVRAVQQTIAELYRLDASKYDREHSLKIGRIYSLIPSNMKNKKKRVVYRDIENRSGKRSADY